MKNILPNFIIVGTAKGGTTSLVNYLSQHPDIFVIGEIKFFTDDNKYKKGLEYYSKFFERWDGEKVIGEKTPNYMYYEKTAKRIHDCLPDVKLIFLLRNPIKRAYSHYWFDVMKGREFLSFEDTIMWEEKPKKQVRFKNYTRYLDRGKYAEQIKRFMDYFPREKMLFIISEKFRKDKEKTLRNILSFLEVDKNFIFEDLKERRVTEIPKSRMLSYLQGCARLLKLDRLPATYKYVQKLDDLNRNGPYPAMKLETEKYLRNHYKKSNKELERILDINVSKYWG